MSTAFTKEESAETASEILLPDRTISPHPNLVTEAGFKALELQLQIAREAYDAASRRCHVWMYMDPVRLQQVWQYQDRWSRLLMYIRLRDAAGRSSPRASMGFRSLPPEWRQDIDRSHADPDIRFGKRRGDRFTIFCHVLQLPR
ncbi:hypothetical protein [Rhizobium sp. P32RR-XVIII]|uniref:hypothetical protein n=1 Tax=Rhizobium sp. P32RR-XVIII TaxID=2726738 RepID=UPI001FED2EA4|nr:hypothetical protein [Rhizobium sp. P32RR-XVIII]